MKCFGSQSTSAPSRVTVEHLPNKTTRVILTDNVVQAQDDEGNDFFTYDEAVFVLDGERKDSPADYEADFESWWVYASAKDDPLPTLEERVSDLEMYIMGMEV